MIVFVWLMLIVLMVVRLVLTAKVQGKLSQIPPMMSSPLGCDQGRQTPARLSATNTKPQDMLFIGLGANVVYKAGEEVCTITAETTIKVTQPQ